MSPWLLAALTLCPAIVAGALGVPALFLVSALALLVAPVIAYRRALKRHAARWATPLPPVCPSPGYRDQPLVPGYVYEIPAHVRGAAAGAFMFGTLFVPAFAAFLSGVALYGLGVLLLPVVYASYRVWCAGNAILVSSEESLDDVEGAGLAAFWAYLVVAALAGCLGLICLVAEPAMTLFVLPPLVIAAGAALQGRRLVQFARMSAAALPLASAPS
ncbi:MAG: hypothetical protein IPG50_09035 [Myxococcales bacterium]|nr:hypothetical protein [Myxococcales bacterium]